MLQSISGREVRLTKTYIRIRIWGSLILNKDCSKNARLEFWQGITV